MKTLHEYIFNNDYEKKKIRVVYGDLCKERKDIDLVICSAFKRRYLPTGDSFIGSLFWEKGISVDLLSDNPYIDMRERGFWII